MSSKNGGGGEVKPFGSPLRIVATVIVLALFAAFGVSSCNSSDETTSRNGNASITEVPSARPQPSAAAALSSLPTSVRDAELRAAKGAPIKLSDYSGKVLLGNILATC